MVDDVDDDDDMEAANRCSAGELEDEAGVVVHKGSMVVLVDSVFVVDVEAVICADSSDGHVM